MPQEGAGFTVDIAAVRRGGATACELATELSAVRGRWAGATDEPGDALGYAETTAVFRRMQDTWFDELGVYIRVLEELCQGLKVSADNYRAAEDGAAARGDDVRSML
jgi:hypothetical protein